MGERSRMVEAAKIGVDEFSLKPVSSMTLRDRPICVLAKPPRIVQRGDSYGPASCTMAGIYTDVDEAIANLIMLN